MDMITLMFWSLVANIVSIVLGGLAVLACIVFLCWILWKTLTAKF